MAVSIDMILYQYDHALFVIEFICNYANIIILFHAALVLLLWHIGLPCQWYRDGTGDAAAKGKLPAMQGAFKWRIQGLNL